MNFNPGKKADFDPMLEEADYQALLAASKKGGAG